MYMTFFKAVPAHHKHQLLLAAFAGLGGGQVASGRDARHDQGAPREPSQIANLFDSRHFGVNSVKVGAAATCPGHGPVARRAQQLPVFVVDHGKMIPRVELQLLFANLNLMPQRVQVGPSA